MMQGPFPPQPGMQMQQGHMMGAPGPGHPMQQGMMHQGVSGPGGPVTQAGPMMGMQSGAPNAHALSHLQPQQAHMFQQQQQQQQQHPGMMNPGQLNPALMAQHNAHRQAILQRQHQQMLAQQQNGMGGFPQQMMMNMNPQARAAALQAGNMGQPMVNLPPHLLQQMQQQQAMSQQAQQQQQQATSNPQQAAAIAQAHQHAQAQAAAQAHQQAQQQQHMQHQQQAIAMQHAQSQQSNHSQSGSQAGPTTTQGPQQGPLRPPSAMSQQASPAPQPTPQQQPQPAPQPRQQTPTPNQTPSMPQQPNPQQSTPAQMQQRAQVQGMQQAAMQPAQANPAAAQAQAANATRLAMMRQSQAQNQNQNQAQNSLSGQCIIKLMLFTDELGRFSASRGNPPNQLSTWQSFIMKFFSESGAFLHMACHRNGDRTKMFEVVYAALPRYFLSQFSTDVESLQITLNDMKELTENNDTKVECERAKFIYTYKNQCQVICHGKLTAFWAAGNPKMEWLQFEMQGHHQMLPRDLLEPLFQQEEINPMNATQSPRQSKKPQKNVQQRQLSEPMMPISRLPTAGVTDWGLSPGLFHYLEIYETMNTMTSLITHYLENPSFTPAAALDNFNAQQTTARTQGAMPPNQGMQQPPQPGMPAGSRTPSGMGQPGLPPNQFMSPAMQNGLLPNGHMSSPSLMQQNHTPSPASHAMAHQQSQSSNTASVNTSPNVSNKRRRSTAKIDVDDTGGDANGAAKVKPSPRLGGNKRVKGNN